MPGINRTAPALIYFDGSPEGVVAADFNTVCMDQQSPTIWRKTTLTAQTTGWVVISQSGIKQMANKDLRFFIEQADGTLKETRVAAGSAGVLTVDANNNISVAAAAGGTTNITNNYTAKAGTVTLALADSGTKTVTFATPFTTGVTYNVVIHFNGSALVYTVTAMSVTAFTFTFLSTLAGTAYWTATPITG